MQLFSLQRNVSSLLVLTGFFSTGLVCDRSSASDLSLVPLYDGRRNELLSTWGGAWSVDDAKDAVVQSMPGPSGSRALCFELGPVKAGESRNLQCFACGFGPTGQHYQTRDMTPYARLDFHLQNTTHVSMRGLLQLKDYRDSLEHRAVYPFELPAAASWTGVSVPLDFAAAGWRLTGQPDLSRLLTIDFLVEPRTSLSAGQVYLADMVLLERGGPIDIDTAPLTLLVERLARRQWLALWGARSRSHGLIPNNSYQSTDAGLNTTAAMLWMLPSAARRHWVEPGEADSYVALLLHTIDRLLDRAHYLPPRNVDWVSLKPSLLPEESAVDAAFMELALHQYRSLPSTPPPLRDAIARTQARFMFEPFACPTGWRMAYRYPNAYGPEGFTACTYDGYTNEAHLVSLAAHLTPGHGVPIEQQWNSCTHRVRARPADPDGGPLVHSLRDSARRSAWRFGTFSSMSAIAA